MSHITNSTTMLLQLRVRQFFWMVMLLTSVPLSVGQERSPPQPPPDSLHPVDKVGSLSPVFTQEWEAAAKTIPDEIWALFENAGWRVNLVEYVVDAAPSLRGTPPRGWPAGYMWDHTDAVHLASQKQLIIAEKRRNQKGQVVTCTRVGGVFRHELGHAFDLISSDQYGFRSAGEAFVSVYQSDIASMSQERRQELRYYLQQNEAGPQETFAEAFGIVFGGGSDIAHQETFRDSFPQTIEFVRQMVAEVGTRRAGASAPIADDSQREKWPRLRRRSR